MKKRMTSLMLALMVVGVTCFAGCNLEDANNWSTKESSESELSDENTTPSNTSEEAGTTEATPDGGTTEATPDGGTTESTPDGGTTESTPDSGTTDSTPQEDLNNGGANTESGYGELIRPNS